MELRATGELLGLSRLWGKLEFLNPTGSFKDRGTAIMISVAREQGVAEIVEDSSGNAGASLAAYAARTGIRAHIFAPASAPAAKIGQIKVYGAQTHSVEGSREATTDAAVAYYTERRLVYASHNLSPYFLEGTKTLAYELAAEMADGPPEHLVMPVGNGSLFIGAWKGFQELLDRGHISKVPRFHCVQAGAISPIVAAYRGDDWSPKREPRRWPEGSLQLRHPESSRCWTFSARPAASPWRWERTRSSSGRRRWPGGTAYTRSRPRRPPSPAWPAWWRWARSGPPRRSLCPSPARA